MKKPANDILSAMSDDELSQIAERISYLRRQVLQKTQAQFAASINVSQTYLSQLENGNRSVNMNFIDQLSSSLKVSPEWLLYGGPDEQIFHSSGVTRKLLEQQLRSDALQNLQSLFSLKKHDVEFLEWYLSLSPEKRSDLSNAIRLIRNIDAMFTEP